MKNEFIEACGGQDEERVLHEIGSELEAKEAKEAEAFIKMPLADCLQGIQSEIRVLKSLENTFAKFNYRNCEMIYAEVKPLLKKYHCYLTLSDEVEMVGDRFYIKATATICKNGESISVYARAREAEAKKGMDEAQLTGACSSYARKYALAGLLLLDDNKDIDACDNSDKTGEKRSEAKQADELVEAKKALFNALLEHRLEKSECKAFVAFAGINVNSVFAIRNFLNSDITSKIIEFKAEILRKSIV